MIEVYCDESVCIQRDENQNDRYYIQANVEQRYIKNYDLKRHSTPVEDARLQKTLYLLSLVHRYMRPEELYFQEKANMVRLMAGLSDDYLIPSADSVIWRSMVLRRVALELRKTYGDRDDKIAPLSDAIEHIVRVFSLTPLDLVKTESLVDTEQVKAALTKWELSRYAKHIEKVISFKKQSGRRYEKRTGMLSIMVPEYLVQSEAWQEMVNNGEGFTTHPVYVYCYRGIQNGRMVFDLNRMVQDIELLTVQMTSNQFRPKKNYPHSSPSTNGYPLFNFNDALEALDTHMSQLIWRRNMDETVSFAIHNRCEPWRLLPHRAMAVYFLVKVSDARIQKLHKKNLITLTLFQDICDFEEQAGYNALWIRNTVERMRPYVPLAMTALISEWNQKYGNHREEFLFVYPNFRTSFDEETGIIQLVNYAD